MALFSSVFRQVLIVQQLKTFCIFVEVIVDYIPRWKVFSFLSRAKIVYQGVAEVN
jgi:hypothetical protein